MSAVSRAGIVPRMVSVREDRIFMQVSLGDFFRLREAKERARIHIEKKCGLVFLLKRLKKRRFFAAGLAVFVMTFAAGSQFVWTVSYEGVESCDAAQLEAAAALAGVRPGVPKRSLRPALEMKNIILNNTDGICWAWVYVKGTRVTVKVRESIIPPEIFNPDTPCDIIAMRSGIIKRVITRRGRCVVTENQAVAPGDTIISGTYGFENEPGYCVHSAGEVEAYTEHVKTGTYKQVRCYKKYTGRKRRFLTLRLFGHKIPLYINGNVRFENYDSETLEYDLPFGIGITKTSCAEYTTEKEPISYETTVEFAVNRLEREISRELLPGSRLVNKNPKVERLDEETISVTLTMNFIEKIGTEKRIEEVTFIEPKTDRAAAGN